MNLRDFFAIMHGMCGRYTISSPLVEIRAVFRINSETSNIINFEPRYNVAPTNFVPIVCASNKGNKLMSSYWGLNMPWRDSIKKTGKLINARSETLHRKPAFRESFKYRRCLIPADGYYEWTTENSRKKQPWIIHPQHKRLFALAGIWETYKDIDGNIFTAFAILTTEASPLIAHIHHRMPVIVSSKNYATWLSAPTTETSPILKPYNKPITSYRVSKRVNNVNNDDENLLSPVLQKTPAQLRLL